MKIIKKIFKFMFAIFLILLGSITGIYVYSKLSPSIEIKSANAFIMYDNTENVFFQGTGSSEWVELENISEHLINATISTEDKNFYKHFGFDIARIAKALLVNIKAGKTKQGASTISQQYAKNLFLDFDKTWERKWNEMWLTIKLEMTYNKDTILEGYLNTINYGHGVYGIENAANYYFNKSAKDLTLAEAAMLTGIPKSPANYSPLVNPDIAKNRQIYILDNMFKNNYITEEELNKAKTENLTYYGVKNLVNLNTIMYYQDAVMNEIKDLNTIPSSFLETGGLRIYTNLDIDAQTNLEEIITNTLPKESNLQTASIMMNPNNGKIIALVGGRDYSISQFNRATNSKRQVGSTMKPLLYYSALENGFTSSTTFLSQETTFTFSNNKTYSPKNYGETYANKPISLAAAISYSDNIYAVKTHMFLGEDSLINISKRLGITANLEEVPSLPLGTASINIIELAAAYAAFANEGNKITPHLINRIEDLNGNVLYQANYEPINILNKSLTYILSELLTTTYDSTFVDYNYPTAINIASKLTKKYALKSGTTDTDNWSIGYNHDLVTAVWIGYDDNRNMSLDEYKYSRNIWADTMESYFKTSEEEHWYDIPSNVTGILVDPISGKPVYTNDTKAKILYYIKGTEPTNADPVFDELE